MQARLEFRRTPLVFFAIAFAIAVTLLLGAVAGYVIKPATTVGAPARVVTVHDESSLYATGDQNPAASSGCDWTSSRRQKAC